MMSQFIKIVTFACIILLGSGWAQQDCSYCKKELLGEYLTSAKGSYHPSCYRDHVQPRCDHCGKLIEDTYKILDDKSYHNSCYTEHVLDKCDVCRQPLEGTYVTDYWGNAYHKYHEQGTPDCGSCGRLISKRMSKGGVTLGDGRMVCGICQSTAVTDQTIRDSYQREVLSLLEQHGIDDLPDDIPITLVDAKTLKNLSSVNSNDMRAFTDQRSEQINGQIVSRKSHIYVLTHLPLTVFKAILAHELLHVYLFEHDLDLPSDVREGFCNLGSELVYEYENTPLADFHLQNMKKNRHPDYGAGYRKMSEQLNQKGWVQLLDDLNSL